MKHINIIPFLLGCILTNLAHADTPSVSIPFDEPSEWKPIGTDAGTGTAVKKGVGEQSFGWLRFEYKIVGTKSRLANSEYLFRPHTNIKGVPETIEMMVKGDGSGRPLRVRFVDADGWFFQFTMSPKVDWEGWRKVQTDLAINRIGSAAWKPGSPGLSKPAKMTPPVRFGGVLIDRITQEEQTSGMIGIGNVQIHSLPDS